MFLVASEPQPPREPRVEPRQKSPRSDRRGRLSLREHDRGVLTVAPGSAQQQLESGWDWRFFTNTCRPGNVAGVVLCLVGLALVTQR